MKKNIGKALFQLLMLVVGICLIVGGIINIRRHGTYLVIIGGFAIGIGMVIFALRGFLTVTKGQ